MLWRSIRSTTTLDQTKQQLARQESELRDQVQKLERIIADAPRLAEEAERRQREELLMRASAGGSRLDVSLALQDKRFGGEQGIERRHGSLRKERREGRILFLVLLIALATAVVWLASHLHF
jgi:septal ring factor EnvC (AmiA/AmiB activator)